MAFTQTDLDAVNVAIASGELTVEFNGRRTTYRSMAELMLARSVIQQEIAATAAAASGTARRIWPVRFATSRDGY